MENSTRKCGAVGKANDGTKQYIGTNTDCIGIREAFLQNFPDILLATKGLPALIIGGGGACRSAVYAIWKWFGVSKIYLVNRLKSEVDAIIRDFKATGFTPELIYVESTEQATFLDAPRIVIGTAPDHPPKESGEILARKITEVFLGKKQKGFVVEMCYYPKPRTEFFQLAEHEGWQVLSGIESMIYQRVAQQVLWTELPLEEFQVDTAKKIILEDIIKE